MIVSSVTSWAADADLFVKNIFEKASMERYDELVLILCLDTDMSKELCSKMLRLNKVTHSTIPIHIQTSSWVSLSATLASCVLKKCNSVDIKLYSEIVKQMSNEKMSERAGFLVSLVPTMSTMAAIQCLSLIAPAEGPVDQFQVLLASEVARKKLCSDLSKSPNIRELSNKSVLQLSCVLNEDLNEKMGL